MKGARAVLGEQLPERLRVLVWIVSNVGFPILVSLFLLVKLNAALELINQTLVKQADLMQQIQSSIAIVLAGGGH